jgi:7-cyano-7-deazaguanine synthase
MKRRNKAVVLLSGGIDSVVTLYSALHYGFSPECLIFNYGQRHQKEVSFAIRNAERLNLPYYLIKIPFCWSCSALTDTTRKIPVRRNEKIIPVTYVPGRNLIFLSFAFSYAESIGSNRIFIGAHVQDYSGYPDCRPEFLSSFEHAANLGIKNRNIKIEAPLLKKRKAEIIKLGYSLGVDFRNTWSCYQGKKYPCLKCDSCRYRKEGFLQAGRNDPLLVKEKAKNKRCK